jgi:hypothetical protein
MGTRANIGFRHKNVDWLMYHHMDGGLVWLGMSIMEFCKSYSAEHMRSQVGEFIRIDDNSQSVSSKEIKEIAKIQNWSTERLVETLQKFTHKVKGKHPDWTFALADASNLEDFMTGLRYWPDYADFIYHSNCEYAYIVNLDTENLEIYTHHYDAPNHKDKSYPKHKPLGRYSDLRYEKGDPEPTRGATLIMEIPFQVLKELPESALKSYAARIDRTH